MSEKPKDTQKPRSSRLNETLLQNAVLKYFKFAGLALAVWGMGYFKFSPSWLLAALVAYVWEGQDQQEEGCENTDTTTNCA